MVNGEDDKSGDMDTLAGDFHWTQHKIIYTYNHIGTVCLVVLIAVYAFFALRLNRALANLVHRDAD